MQGPIQKRAKAKKGWGHGSNVRVRAWQVQGLSSNPNTAKKKKN
jgi:hypothetical protein